MDKQYISKRLTRADVPALLQLYKSAFGFNADKNAIQSKFFHDYQKINASFFSSSDIIASFYGMIVQKAIFNNEIFLVGQSCDSMTHKAHGGKGLFVNLASEVYNYLKQEGVDYVFGFPNTTIYNLRIKKLLWQHNEDINVFKLKVVALPFAKLVKKMPGLKRLYIWYLNMILNKYKSTATYFSNSVLEKDVAGIMHDADYFNYKRTADKFIITINDLLLWIKIDGFLWVGDFEITSEKEFSAILKKLKRIAVISGCTSIVFHFQENTPNDILLKKFLAIDSKMPMGFIHLSDKRKGIAFKFSGSDFDSW